MKLFRLATLLIASLVTSVAAAQASPDVIEFHNPGLDHYFVTANATEAAAIDNGGAGPGWTRTGLTFKAGGPTPVCRFYGSQSPGPNSHFYTADPGECDALKALQANTPATQKRWNFESLDFQTTVPVGGTCPAGTTPVYRAYNNGFARGIDSNHRITTSQLAIQQVVARGWVNEGVVMCAIAGPVNALALSLSSANVLLLPGESRDVYVTLTPRTGFSGVVSLSATGLPAGVQQQLSAATVNVGPGASSASTVVLHLTAATSAPVTIEPAIVSLVARANDGVIAQAAIAVGVASAGDPVARRLSTIAAVEERARSLGRQGLSPLALVQNISMFMATRPEYQATGVDVESISAWGRFTDGRLHLVVNNRAPAPATVTQGDQRVDLKAGGEVPATTQARLLHTFGFNFEGQAPIEEMRGYLRSAGWGVRAGSEGQASVEMLKRTNDDGFFYINTHGGQGDIGDPSEPNGRIYSIQTSTLVTSQYEQLYEADLAAYRLVHMTALNGDRLTVLGFDITGDWDTRYAITYRFVDQYMRFSKASVAYINACFSGRSASFINAFIRKGAGVYLGWSALLSSDAAYKSAPYFVDRMLGVNQNPDKETPPQRAFSYDLVLQDMAKKGLDTDPANGGKLQPTVNSTLKHPPIFAPSIRYARIDEVQELLTLNGQFGDEQGKVTVGGVEATPVSWSATEIVAKILRTGTGSSGDVIVEVRGVRSNARQLTSWTIPLRYLADPAYGKPGLKYEGNGVIRYRADIAAFRTIPGEPVRFLPQGGVPDRDSGLPLTASGSYNSGSCTETLTGNANYISPSALDGRDVPVLASAFHMSGDTRNVNLTLGFGATRTPHRLVLTGNCPSQSSHDVAPTFTKMDGFLDVMFSQGEPPFVVQLPALRFTLDANYGVPAVNRAFPDGNATINVNLSPAPAQSPPRDGIDAGK